MAPSAGEVAVAAPEVTDASLQATDPVPGARPSPLRRSVAELALFSLPLAAVVLLGLWTPSPVRTVLDQVVVVLGGGHG